MHISYRLSAIIVALLLLVGCGSSGTDDGKATSDGNYPVTVETKYGKVSIPEKPETVVLLSWSLVEPMEVVGAKADHVQWWGQKSGAKEIFDEEAPWLEDRLNLDTVTNDLMDTDFSDINLDKVLSLDPDLIIVGPWSVDDDIYQELKRIAPTVVPSESDMTDRRRQIRIFGSIFDADERAKKTIAETERILAEAEADLPELKGRTYQAGWLDADGNVNLTGEDRILNSLGLTPGENQPKVGATGKPNVISAENRSKLNADVLWISGPPDAIKEFESDPRIKASPAVRNQAAFFPVGTPEADSIAFGPLRSPWWLERFLPRLKDTAYVVEE